MDYLRDGCAPAEIAADLDLTDEQVRAAIDYIEGHRAEVEVQYELILQRVNQPNPAWVVEGRAATVDEMRRRLAAR